MAKPALGRGLGALLGGNPVLMTTAPSGRGATSAAAPAAPGMDEQVRRVPLDRIRACPLQPRKDFSAESLRI